LTYILNIYKYAVESCGIILKYYNTENKKSLLQNILHNDKKDNYKYKSTRFKKHNNNTKVISEATKEIRQKVLLNQFRYLASKLMKSNADEQKSLLGLF
jgi:hypothetical protein